MNGYDCKTMGITTDFDVSLYCKLAAIPKYQNNGAYTQGHKFVLRFDEPSVDFRSTTVCIFTSNSSDTIRAWYSGYEPELNVIINDDGDSWGIYVKPSGAYSVPICMEILAAENPAALELVDGDYPRISTSTLTSQVEINPKNMYINNNNVIMTSNIQSYISSPVSVGLNYDVSYNSAENNSICPNTVSGIWFVSYREGSAQNAIQYWTMVNGSTVYRYVRAKSSNTAWGDFVEI